MNKAKVIKNDLVKKEIERFLKRENNPRSHNDRNGNCGSLHLILPLKSENEEKALCQNQQPLKEKSK
jgi:hypothetical protein